MEESIESEKLVTSEWLEENWDNPSIRIVEVDDIRTYCRLSHRASMG